LSLDEVEALRRSLKVCPKCGSSEGFWLTAKRDAGYVQCKHCGAVIELCEVHSIEAGAKKGSQSKRGILRRELKF
jgi:transcription elongation factor Elf1